MGIIIAIILGLIFKGKKLPLWKSMVYGLITWFTIGLLIAGFVSILGLQWW